MVVMEGKTSRMMGKSSADAEMSEGETVSTQCDESKDALRRNRTILRLPRGFFF